MKPEQQAYKRFFAFRRGHWDGYEGNPQLDKDAFKNSVAEQCDRGEDLEDVYWHFDQQRAVVGEQPAYEAVVGAYLRREAKSVAETDTSTHVGRGCAWTVVELVAPPVLLVVAIWLAGTLL